MRHEHGFYSLYSLLTPIVKIVPAPQGVFAKSFGPKTRGSNADMVVTNTSVKSEAARSILKPPSTPDGIANSIGGY